MVSSISNPGFPHVHTRHSDAPRFSSLEDRVASLEATMASLLSLIDTAIEKAFATKLPAYFDKFRRELHSQSAGEGISAPFATDHHVSPAIELIQAPPLLSSSPLLRALATSTVIKPQSNDSSATTISLPALKTVIHASTMTIAPRLLHEHSFSDTTKTGPEDFCAWNLFDEIPDSSCYAVLDRDMCYCNGIRDKGGSSKIRPLEDCQEVNWYLVGKFVKKNFCALQLFDRLSKRGSENVHVLSVASLDMHDLEASTKLDGSSSTPMVKEVSSEEEANVFHTEIKITEYHGSDANCDLSEKSNNDSVESGDCASQIRDDRYLLFKRLCKMSMKYSSDEHSDDQILLRGIVLSLELLQVVIDDRGPIRCNNEMFLNAIKQFLCLSLLHISALLVMAIFEPLSSSSNEKLLFDRCPKTKNVLAHVVQSLNEDLPASTVGKLVVVVHNSVSSLSSPFSRDLKRLQGGAAVRSVLQLLSSGYWDELFQFINVEFDHVKGMENLGVRWMTLATASLLILLFDGMSKRHNYNWNSHSCSYAVWNAPMLCGLHKLMHHLVLQIHDHDWHPIGDTKSIKVEVKVSVGIGHRGYIILWWLLWRMKAIGITTSFAKAPMKFVSPVELQLRMACILFYSWAALFVTDQAIHDRIKGIITSMNAHIPYFKKIFSMIANRLTRFLNLKIEVNLPLTYGTTIASILFLLIHGMLFKELLWLAEMKQYCDDANLSDASPLNLKKSLIAHTLYFLEVTSRVADNHNNSGKHCDGEDSAAWFHSNTIYTVDIYPLFENAGLFEPHIQQHGAAASAIERKSLVNHQQNKRVNYKKQTRGHFVVKLFAKEIAMAIKFPDAMEIAGAIDKVSCLGEFKNLERLDLSFNNLNSLEGLKSCVNLKWLSVANNKLQSLNGIEGFTKLTVLNAGNNKLKAMDEVKSIVSLRAVILNDNEIASICRLEPLRELNTLVLSRNPIHDIGDSLKKLKSITKLSFSHCQLQTIEASLKFCIELKELRLAHNDIKSLPAELALNKKLQNLDLGNNVISRWSDLKVINSLVNLRNLNLQGNTVVEKDKLVKKIKKMLPNLHVFNARPIDKYIKNKKGAGIDEVDEVDDSSLNTASKRETQTEVPKYRDFKHRAMGETNGDIENASHSDTKKSKRKRQGSKDNASNNVVVEGDEKRDPVKKKNHKHQMQNEDDRGNLENTGDFEKASQQKQQKKSSAHTEDNTKVGKKSEKSQVRKGDLDVIDDADTPFLELFSVDAEVVGEERAKDKVIELGGLVTFPCKSKRAENLASTDSTLQPSHVDEIGTGGPSTWGYD